MNARTRCPQIFFGVVLALLVAHCGGGDIVGSTDESSGDGRTAVTGDAGSTSDNYRVTSSALAPDVHAVSSSNYSAKIGVGNTSRLERSSSDLYNIEPPNPTQSGVPK